MAGSRETSAVERIPSDERVRKEIDALLAGPVKRRLAHGRFPLRKQERRLLRRRGQGPERALLRGREPTL
jgi:hypothetical protein